MVGTALPLSNSSIRALSRLICSRRLPISLSFIRPRNADKDSDDGSESMELFLIVVQSGNYVSKSQSSTQYLGMVVFRNTRLLLPIRSQSGETLYKSHIRETISRPTFILLFRISENFAGFTPRESAKVALLGH